MGVRRLFPGDGKNFPGEGARTYFFPKKTAKKILFFSKKSKNILFLASQGGVLAHPRPPPDAYDEDVN